MKHDCCGQCPVKDPTRIIKKTIMIHI